MNRKAVIFDLDGTLWETTNSTYLSFNIVAKKHNIKEISEEIIKKNYGNNKVETAELFFPDLNQEEAFKLIEEADDINIKYLSKNGGYTYPGLEEALFRLNIDYDLFIVSNSANKKYIESFLTS